VARADEHPTNLGRLEDQAAAGEKMEVEEVAGIVPPQSVDVELAVPPQEEVEAVVALDFAPAFGLAPRILPPACLAGVQPHGGETHQQAASMKKEALLATTKLAVKVKLVSI
jgi:hypothetical protein